MPVTETAASRKGNTVCEFSQLVPLRLYRFCSLPELINAGHQVLGLARTDAGAQSLIDAGAEVHRGDLEDLESLRSGAAMSDGVIHTAFNHDFSKFAANCEMDRRAIETLGSALAGSDRPLVVTSGTGSSRPPGRALRMEDDAAHKVQPSFPRVSEQTAASLAARGVRASVVRLPQVHDRVKQGLVTRMTAIEFFARRVSRRMFQDTVSTAVALRTGLDKPPLPYKLAFEKESAGARYHAVDEQGVTLREIAEAIGRGLKVPVVAMSPEQGAGHRAGLPFRER